MKNFVLIGAAGYIAPRHMKAIKDTGNRLVAALDKHDSVGVLDSYFPEADFFTEFERFDRHCDKLIRSGRPIDYVVVCSPNYLHDAHIRFGLRIGADVICEKPVVLNPWNVDALLEMEKETGKHVYTILQLRYHPSVIALYNEIKQEQSEKKYKIDLQYITSRGKWYQHSWKGDINKSGGITTNIGLHFFDILLWIFGNVRKMEVTKNTATTAAGHILLDNAEVNWMLSIDENMLPEKARKSGKQTFRLLKIGEREIEFDTGFETLHTQSYKAILSGEGISLSSTYSLIKLTHAIRNRI